MTNGTGVVRAYTLVDVLAAINDQSGQGSAGTAPTALTVPLSAVAEADDQTTTSDSAFGSTQTNILWDQGVWSAATWN